MKSAIFCKAELTSVELAVMEAQGTEKGTPFSPSMSGFEQSQIHDLRSVGREIL